MGILDRVLIPEFEPTPEHADPRTVWSAIGTPMIDPDGTSDAARSITIARPIARVVTREATARQLIADANEELRQAHIGDAAIMDALGLGTRRTTPWTNLRPADYVQLRVFLSEGLVLSARRYLDLSTATDDDPYVGLALEAVGCALLLHDAVPFFIPASIASALMTSEPPDATLNSEIRLPFPSVVTFFDAIPLGDLQLDGGLFDANGNTLDPNEASLVGAVLYAGPNGTGLDPVADWILSLPVCDTHGVVMMSGVWQSSAQPGVIANLAALCTWGAWNPPPPIPPQVEGDRGSRQWRRSLSRSAVRKALSHGAVIGVHVVDLGSLGRDSNASAGSESDTTGRTVRAHWRRGYWNSVRVATRDQDGNIIGNRLGTPGSDWHYEGRWIHPVLVHGTNTNVLTVYTVRT